MEISISPEVLGHLGSLPITNSLLVVFLVDIILIVGFLIITRKLTVVPKGGQFFAETLFDGMYDFMLGLADSKKLVSRMFPYLMTIFLFFLCCNLLEFIPGITALTYNGTPVFRNPVTDLNVVFTISMLSFIIMELTGIISGGLWKGYLRKFFDFSSPVNFGIGLMELVNEYSRPISLTFRIFGNLFAGVVITIVLMKMAPYIIPVPFNLLALAISIIQPFVFIVLVLVFTKLNVYEAASPQH